jgi:uncharacterized protein YcbK (DUF882 family)
MKKVNKHYSKNTASKKQSPPPKPAKKSNKLSDHFSKKDFDCRCGKCKSSLRISLGLLGGLELLRSLAKQKVFIVKGYQCPDSAENQRKIKRNFHTTGVAADITIEKIDLKAAFLLAEEVPEFMGIGLDLEHQHVHVDTRKEKERALWIVTENGETIPITEENRAQYFDQ